jgi:hypothetical protein
MAGAENEITGTLNWVPISATKAASSHLSIPIITSTSFSSINFSAARIIHGATLV